MKTGLIVLQSIASSVLRSASPKRQLCQGKTWALPLAFLHVSKLAGCSNPRNRLSAASFFATAGIGLVGGGTAATMCSNDSQSAHDISSKRKSIDEPTKTPRHNSSLPFPEESLRHDTYSGVTLDVSKLPGALLATIDPDTFKSLLSQALEIWQIEDRRGIWIRIPTSYSHLISPATTLGFDFQHAEPGYCVLTKWLPADTPSRLPNGPTHQVGIGALVIHPLTGKMLAVQERTGPAAARKLWKMPTGLTDPGEDIATAAVRELKEETGLDCVFDKIICFRQSHGGLFNRSDMFFICLCKLAPKYEEVLKNGGEIEISPQEEEILCADWMDLEDYAHQSVWRESPLYKEMNGAMIRAARSGITFSSVHQEGNDDERESHGFVAKNLPVGIRPGSNTIYVSSKL
mmetsp:Transcript_551/g.1125  ORF Transcript_551/g.1125 Transcript_551/m.1125 type:complete len:403 (+) Transcript_551:71-1279(+)